VFILGDSSTAEFTMNQSTPGEDETIKSKSTETREITLSVSETGNEDINTKNNEPHCKFKKCTVSISIIIDILNKYNLLYIHDFYTSFE
jgi:hypothetical protein